MVCAVVFAPDALAQRKERTAPKPATDQTSRTERRERALTQLREYKHNVLAKELKLSAEQKTKFFPLYDELDSRREELNAEARDIERRINTDKSLSDVALESYAKRLFEQKQLEGQLELEYYDRFRAILTPRQMALLRSAEMQVVRNLNRFHHGTPKE